MIETSNEAIKENQNRQFFIGFDHYS